MPDTWTQALQALVWIKLHLPFFAYTAFFAFVGEVSKRHIFTDANEKLMEKQADKLWNKKGIYRVPALIILALTRSPLAFHPVAAGFLLGLIPGIPLSAGVHYGIQSIMYCMGAGWLSLAFYDILHAVYKFVWKNVLRQTTPPPEIHLPGEDSVPPPAPGH